jgi:hypothetical protein
VQLAYYLKDQETIDWLAAQLRDRVEQQRGAN